jgi:hypothetical protein
MVTPRTWPRVTESTVKNGEIKNIENNKNVEYNKKWESGFYLDFTGSF